jgi:hypothetical protein
VTLRSTLSLRGANVSRAALTSDTALQQSRSGMACLAGVPAAAVIAVFTRNLADATPTDDAIPINFPGQKLPGLACAPGVGPAAADAPGSVRANDGVPFLAAVFDIAVSIASMGPRARALQAADDPLGLAGVLGGGPMPAPLSPLQLAVLQATVTLSSGLQLPAPDATGATPDSNFGGQMAPWLARLGGPAVDAWAVQLLLNGIAYYNLNGTNMRALAAKLAAVASASPSATASASGGGGGGLPLAAIAAGASSLLLVAAALAAALIVLRRRRARARARVASGASVRVNPLAGIDGVKARATGSGVDGVNPLARLRDAMAKAAGGSSPQPSPRPALAAKIRVVMSARAAMRIPDVFVADGGADTDAAAASSRRMAAALAAAPNRAREMIRDRNASTRQSSGAEIKPADGGAGASAADPAAASEAARARREALRENQAGSLRIIRDGSAEIAARSEQVLAMALAVKPHCARQTASELAALAATPLPPGWGSANDKVGDTYYFTADAMRELRVAWERPTMPADGALAADASLPAGWFSALDPDDGDTPYFFCAAGLIVWQRPHAPAPGVGAAATAVNAPLPAGWTSARDADGDEYFFAGETVVWQRPTVPAAPGAEAAAVDGAAGDAAKPTEMAASGPNAMPLPAGWASARDADGDEYFFSGNTVVWTRPTVPAPR